MRTKIPTLKEKVEKYESFLHKINMFVTCGNQEGVKELVMNADNWSYMHRIGNGEISEAEQKRLINQAFWNLCETNKTNKE
jgi:hypothetical protein